MNIIKHPFLYIGYILVLLSAIILPHHISFAELPLAAIIMAIGALSLTIERALHPIEHPDSIRTKRFRIQQAIGTLAFWAACYFMYFNDKRWILTTLVGALIDIIIVFRLPQNKE